MYKSSQLTFVFKYIFPVFMLFGMTFGIYIFWTSGNQELQAFAKGFSVMAVWILIFIVQMPFRLKNIETTENGILITDFNKKRLIKYRDINWISKFDLSNPWALTLKYYDQNSGLDKKISYLPNQMNKGDLKNDAMTNYILEMIEKHNPDYSKDNQPSPVRNILILTLLGLPFILGFLYFSGFLNQFTF